MPLANLSPSEIVRRGKEWYERDIRSRLETPENIGKILVIDTETGDYELGETTSAPYFRMRERNPDHMLFTMRIGYRAAVSFGGAMRRTS